MIVIRRLLHSSLTSWGCMINKHREKVVTLLDCHCADERDDIVGTAFDHFRFPRYELLL